MKTAKALVAIIMLSLPFVSCSRYNTITRYNTVNGNGYSVKIPKSFVKMQQHPRLFISAGNGVLYVDKNEDSNCITIDTINIPNGEDTSIDKLIVEFKDEGAEKITINDVEFFWYELPNMLIFVTTHQNKIYRFVFYFDAYYATFGGEFEGVLALVDSTLQTLVFK